MCVCVCVCKCMCMCNCVCKGGGRRKVNEPGGQGMKKVDYLAAGEARKAIFWLTPGFGFSEFAAKGYPTAGSFKGTDSPTGKSWSSDNCISRVAGKGKNKNLKMILPAGCVVVRI